MGFPCRAQTTGCTPEKAQDDESTKQPAASSEVRSVLPTSEQDEQAQTGEFDLRLDSF